MDQRRVRRTCHKHLVRFGQLGRETPPAPCGFTIPAFSPAIFPQRVPQNSFRGQKSMRVMMDTSGITTFVAVQPPRPAPLQSLRKSTRFLAQTLQKRQTRSRIRSTSDAPGVLPFSQQFLDHYVDAREISQQNRSSEISSPEIRMRSLIRSRCGEVFRARYGSPRRAKSFPENAAWKPLPVCTCNMHARKTRGSGRPQPLQ